MMVQISDKAMGAIMYMLDNRPIMLDRLGPRWGAKAVEAAIDRIYEPIEDREIPEPLTEVERDVLRECVEGSLWLKPYVSNGPSPAHLEEARSTLRHLAGTLDLLGIEVSHIPFD